MFARAARSRERERNWKQTNEAGNDSAGRKQRREAKRLAVFEQRVLTVSASGRVANFSTK